MPPRGLEFEQTHAIVYCSKCGLVHQDNQPPKITLLMEEANQEELERKTIMCKLKKQKHNQMLILNKQGNYLFNQWFFYFLVIGICLARFLEFDILQ